MTELTARFTGLTSFMAVGTHGVDAEWTINGTLRLRVTVQLVPRSTALTSWALNVGEKCIGGAQNEYPTTLLEQHLTKTGNSMGSALATVLWIADLREKATSLVSEAEALVLEVNAGVRSPSDLFEWEHRWARRVGSAVA